MDWVLPMGATVIGVTATWFFARHYYLKTVAEQTFVRALVQAAKREVRSQEHAENGQLRSTRSAPPEYTEDDNEKMRLDAPNHWVRSLVEAYERGEVSPAEVMAAGGALRNAGQMIGGTVRAIYADVNHEPIPMTFSHEWSMRVTQGWRKHMAELGDTLRKKG